MRPTLPCADGHLQPATGIRDTCPLCLNLNPMSTQHTPAQHKQKHKQMPRNYVPAVALTTPKAPRLHTPCHAGPCARSKQAQPTHPTTHVAKLLLDTWPAAMLASATHCVVRAPVLATAFSCKQLTNQAYDCVPASTSSTNTALITRQPGCSHPCC